MSIFNHGDFLRRFAGIGHGTRFLFLPCRDRIVFCRVRLHIVLAGSLHPSAAEIIDALRQTGGSLSVGELTERVGGIGIRGTRFIGEVLARLLQAGEIFQPNTSTPNFALSPTSVWQENSRVDTVDHSFCYLPRSRQLSWSIPSHREALSRRERWWRPPDEDSLYDRIALAASVPEACHAFVKSMHDISSWLDRDTRSEGLERCKLLLRTPELMRAEILELSVPENHFVIHRCYFQQPSAATLWAKVYRFRELIRDEGYSAYFETAALSNPSVLQTMYDADPVDLGVRC